MLYTKRIILAVIFSLFAALSLTLKLTTMDKPDLTDQWVKPFEISHTLLQKSFQRLGHSRLINSPHYAAEIYTGLSGNPECNGLLFILSMPENSEAEALLATPSGFQTEEKFYILNHHIYDTFPSYRFWLSKIKHRLLQLFGLEYKQNIVFGVSSTDQCLNARTLPWSRIVKELYLLSPQNSSQYEN